MKFTEFKTAPFTIAQGTAWQTTTTKVLGLNSGQQWEEIAILGDWQIERGGLEKVKKNANAEFNTLADIIAVCTVSTEERYWDLCECLPPMYFKQINGFGVQSGFFCPEAADHNEKGGIYSGMFQHEGVYYAFNGYATSLQGKPITDSYEYEFSNVNAFFYYY